MTDISEWGIFAVFILLFIGTTGLFVFFDRKFGHLFLPPKLTKKEKEKVEKQMCKESDSNTSYTSVNNYDTGGSGCDGGSC
ncbi:hypothetical protein [Agarilytica rhodophyticola]|uniref:hypothetical protein n=1 Tax=Agarilytica rhodophyticola TaxID=1737490 RepID=UPI000B34556C|nr:hypothetical protein [Agarilytica rhodophyticola]